MSATPVIAVDGPGGAGKGELTGRLATALGFHLLDSGAIYRVLGYAARQAGLALFDEESLVREAGVMGLEFRAGAGSVKVYLNGADVTQAIRTEDCGEAASKVAALPAVRLALLKRQRDFAVAPGLVADGRDMGTVVFPGAQVKIFLTASAEVRAERRVRQMQELGISADYSQVLADIQKRDERDRSRSVAPLVPADDAVVLDSTALSREEVFARAMEIIAGAGIG